MTSPARSTRTIEDRARLGLGVDTQDDNTDPATDETPLTIEGVLEAAPTTILNAEDVAIADSANQYTATEVESALAEVLDAEQAHEANAVGAHAATAVSFTPAGTIAATTVQAAVEEASGDLTTHEAATLGASVHGLVEISGALVDGVAEFIAVDEVKILTLTGGAENDTFTLTVGGSASGTVTIPAGGFAAVTAAQIQTALEGGAMAVPSGSAVVTGSAGGPFTITYAETLAATNIGNMTFTGATGAAAGTILDDGTGASVQGVTATVITVSGIEVGDTLFPVLTYATKAAISTATVRPASDFTVGAGGVTVVANPVDNSAPNQYYFQWFDFTP